MAIHKNSDKQIPVQLPTSIINSDTEYVVKVRSIDGWRGFTREQKRNSVIDAYKEDILPENPPPLPIRYIDIVHVFRNGDYIYIERPGRNKGSDGRFMPNVPFVDIFTGKPLKAHSYTNIKDELRMKQLNNPADYERMKRIITRMLLEDYAPSYEEIDALHFTVGQSVEYLLGLINCAFVEQDVAYGSGMGRRFPYSIMPKTLEEMSKVIDLSQGIIDTQYLLRDVIKSGMTTVQIRAALKPRNPKLELHCTACVHHVNNDTHSQIHCKLPEPIPLAYGYQLSELLCEDVILDENGVCCIVYDEHNDDTSVRFWFHNTILPFAESIQPNRAIFHWGYIALNTNGTADIFIAQNWSEKIITQQINRLKTMTVTHVDSDNKEIPTSG